MDKYTSLRPEQIIALPEGTHISFMINNVITLIEVVETNNIDKDVISLKRVLSKVGDDLIYVPDRINNDINVSAMDINSWLTQDREYIISPPEHIKLINIARTKELIRG